MNTQFYCDCQTGVDAYKLHEKGWVYVSGNVVEKSECLKCKDTGVIPTVYCTCPRGDFRKARDFGGPIDLHVDLHCEVCMGGGVVAGGQEYWDQEFRNEERRTPSGLVFFERVRVVTRKVRVPPQPVEETTSLGLARLSVTQRDLAHLVEPEDGLVDFEAARASKDLEEDLNESLPQAVVEVVWGENGFKTSFSMLKCPDREAAVLLPPETPRERYSMLRNLRWVVNYMALKWGLANLIREEDWGDDKRGD